MFFRVKKFHRLASDSFSLTTHILQMLGTSGRIIERFQALWFSALHSRSIAGCPSSTRTATAITQPHTHTWLQATFIHPTKSKQNSKCIHISAFLSQIQNLPVAAPMLPDRRNVKGGKVGQTSALKPMVVQIPFANFTEVKTVRALVESLSVP